MSFVRRLLVAAALAAPVVVGACRDHGERVDRADRGERDDSAGSTGVGASFHARDTTRRLGPGDIRIESTDRSIELGLIGDSIVTGLGSAVLDKVSAKTDTTDVKGNGLGASIEKMVKSTVSNALGHELLLPISDISDVRYEDGRLQFYDARGTRMHMFENSKVNGNNTSALFSKDDSDRFIAAFHARKATMAK